MKIAFTRPVDSLHPFILEGLGTDLDALITHAKNELADKVRTLADASSATWGFFPELHPNRADYPACVALHNHFDREFLASSLLQSFDLQLAFIRLATSEPQSAFGGLHIDASAGIDHVPPKDRPAKKNGILRAPINLYDEPRELQYSPNTIDWLRAKGVSIPEDHYEVIALPSEMQVKSYMVRPREPGKLHGIMFESRSTLHAGRTNQKGHFLLSYGGYASKTLISRLLR